MYRAPNHHRRRRERARRGFTLTELLIAILVLVIVILGTARIFGTASEVTGLGQATAAALQEAAVIERRMREDIRRLSTNGFFAVRQVAIPNNLHGDEAPLINPNLPADAWIRADQLVFFTEGGDAPQFGMLGGQFDAAISRTQSAASRVYYGHAFQLPDANPYQAQSLQQGHAIDPAENVYPWDNREVSMTSTLFSSVGAAGGSGGTNVFSRSGFGTSIDATQPEARRWLLARQSVALVDDDRFDPDTNAKTVHLNNLMTARSIFSDQVFGSAHPVFGWSREIRNGRLDAAASELDDIRRYITFNPDLGSTGQRRPWRGVGTGTGLNQLEIISNQSIYYPRAERRPPSTHRVDEALSRHVIGSAVSNFIIEWTWSDGTGEVLDSDGNLALDQNLNEIFGFQTNTHDSSVMRPEQPWFGLNLPNRGVGFYGSNDYRNLANFERAYAVFADDIEFYSDTFFPQYPGVEVYEAIFGYNRDRPGIEVDDGLWDIAENHDLGFTPWPTAIRVTMTLHDPAGRLENGRRVQFVIDLPKRAR